MAMFEVAQQQQRFVKENLLCLGWYYIVFIDNFMGIALIPFKTINIVKIDHDCILSAYTCLAGLGNKPLQAAHNSRAFVCCMKTWMRLNTPLNAQPAAPSTA
jgi:hypothetical protein